MKVEVEFSGGLELLFNNQKRITIEGLKDDTNLAGLIAHLKAEHLKEKEEMFVVAGTVRAGIIVLINDCDWELEGGIEYQIKDKDTIAFISTLHGG
jgi:ubiquitin related modifier 1